MADESNLTTLAALKAWLDPSPQGSASDTALTSLINQASNVITDQLSLVIAPDTVFTETYNGNGKGCMTLRQFPATSVTSVSIGTTALTSSVNQSAGFLLDTSSNTLHYIGGVFPRDVMNVTVVYKAGIPAGDRRLGSLERACLHTCALWWKRRPHIDQTSMAAPNGLGTISFTQADLPKEAWTIIRQLQRVAPAL